jgi:hypothetical protein
LTEPLLRERVEAGFRYDAKIASERKLKAHPKAVAAIGCNDRLCAARRRGDVPGEPGNVLRRCLQETLDIAATRKMLAGCSQNDDADARILVQSLEHEPKLIALGHGYDVERRPIENDIGSFALRIDFHAEPVKHGKPRIRIRKSGTHRIPPSPTRYEATFASARMSF